MKYELILEKGNYALIKRGNEIKEYAVVRNLNKEDGTWDYSCGVYDYSYKEIATHNQAEMLALAIEEFREKTEEDYEGTKNLEIYREDYSVSQFREILNTFNLNDDEVGEAFSVHAKVNKNTLKKEDEEYIPCAENGDYSPSNPWDAPGMCISDFI